MLILVNSRAKGGVAGRRWARVRAELATRETAFDEVAPTSPDEMRASCEAAMARGEKVVVAAGGDGTVNLVLNAIMDPKTDRARGDVALGAIGIGSSNDFHKPVSRDRMIAGVSMRIDAEAGAHADVGKATFVDTAGRAHVRYFILNASMGIVAEGNAFFNTEDRFLVLLKRLHTEVAILYTALVNIARFRPLAVRFRVDDGSTRTESFVNIGILKSVHFSGGMRYDTSVTRDDGAFDVNLWREAPKVAVLRMVPSLYAGHFKGRPRTECLRGARVAIEPLQPAALELDGEIAMVTRAELTVLPRALRLCA